MDMNKQQWSAWTAYTVARGVGRAAAAGARTERRWLGQGLRMSYRWVRRGRL
jgi:hypothetical protein